MKTIALYVHIPFCARRCAYCHFDIKVLHPQTVSEPIYRRFEADLCREIRTRATQFGDRSVGSIFFGGGTPSRLPLGHYQGILDCIRDSFSLRDDCEINMELNPEDVDPPYLDGLASLGINRVSCGVQTFDQAGLEAIGRLHSAEQAKGVLQQARDRFAYGVSLDLILGLPYQTRQTLAYDLNIITELAPEHVSLYMLERDLPTTLDKLADRFPMPDEDQQASFYEQVCQSLAVQGFGHYEISNWAKPGFECRHNQVYWECGDYLGLGPAAVGRVGLCLEANHRTLTAWQNAVEAEGLGVADAEQWDAPRFQQERIIQGLRLRKGIPNQWLNEAQWARLALALEHGLLKRGSERLTLTEKGCLLGNEVFEMLIEEP